MKVLFYPDEVRELSTMYRLIEVAGIETTNNPEDEFDIAYFWSYHKTILEPPEKLSELMNKYNIINIGGLDITKSNVERVMLQTFGYNSLVDPKNTAERFFIQKNDRQTNPCIRIIESGTEYQQPPNTICSKLLNDNAKNCWRVFRCFISGEMIVGVEAVYRPDQDRFGESVNREFVDQSRYFSKDERRLLIQFCKNHKTEFTELDVIRHEDNRIYVVDNNNIPARAIVWPGPDVYTNEFYKQLSDSLMELLNRWA